MTQTKKLDLTEGNPLVAIILFTIPLLLGNVFQQFYTVIDSVIVGNFVSDEALAAVSSSESLLNFFISIIQGVSVGGGIVIARYFGAKDYQTMKKSIYTLTVFSLLLGSLLTFIGYIFSQEMLVWMGTPEDVLPLSTQYFKVYFLGCIFTCMYNCGASIFRSLGDSKTPLYFLILSSVCNIFLDLFFILVFNLGVASVALATIISQGISAFLTYLKLMRDDAVYKFKLKEVHLDFKQLKLIIAYGIPMGIQNSIISLSNVFIQANINAFGTQAMAGTGCYNKIHGFATLPSGSFSMALSTYVSQNIGARKNQRARKGALLGLGLDMLITELLSVAVLIWAKPLIDLFTDSEEVIAYGASQAKICCFFGFLLAYAHGMSGILRGAGYSKTPMFILIICWVAVRIIFIPIAIQYVWNDIRMIYMFYPITWSLSFIALTVCALIFPWAKDSKKA